MLHLTLTINGNTLDMSGEDLTVNEAFPVITDWLAALPGADAQAQAIVDRLTARLAAANTRLLHDVSAATPAS